MHAYINARRRRNLAILRIMTTNFFGFSNAAFIFFIFHIFLYFTFSHLLYFTFSHLLDFTFSHLLDNSIIGFYIFSSFGFLNLSILHFSLLSFLLWRKYLIWFFCQRIYDIIVPLSRPLALCPNFLFCSAKIDLSDYKI